MDLETKPIYSISCALTGIWSVGFDCICLKRYIWLFKEISLNFIAVNPSTLLDHGLNARF